MKILFLDVDGVLNNEHTTDRFNGLIGLDDRLLLILQKIVLSTKCQIVLSSTWRKYHKHKVYLTKKLDDLGLSIFGYTPISSDGHRGSEIDKWLGWLADTAVTKFAILDDDSDAGENGLAHSFFQTEWSIGLTEDIAEKVIAHLGEEV